MTIDQRYRVERGGSEIDLAPGATVELLLWAGAVTMSGSSPGIGANVEFTVNGGSVAAYDVTFYEIDQQWRLSLAPR
ncbi:MAG: hypothetical protein H3C34_12890 [Caldilineaceae bacterium]|nr:hypothetical protein [Caldilineaceae bacterium]